MFYGIERVNLQAHVDRKSKGSEKHIVVVRRKPNETTKQLPGLENSVPAMYFLYIQIKIWLKNKCFASLR